MFGGDNTFINRIVRTSEKIEDFFFVRVIRSGLIAMIPLLILGAFALLFQTFPIAAYQTFITTFGGGFIYSFFHIIYMATFGIMSLYMALCCSASFFILKAPEKPANMWGVGTAVVCFMIMVGVWSDDFSVSDLGAASVFLAIATSFVSSEIFCALSDRYIKYKFQYTPSADAQLGKTMASLLPAGVSVAIAALLAYLVTLTGNATMHELVTNLFLSFFDLINSYFLKGLLYIFLSSLLWLFGIHGSDCLQGVCDDVFVPLTDANALAAAAGGTPTAVVCKPFFDCYILMGGCGSCLCLVIAILLFSNNKVMKTIARASGLPILFNISELMVFGLPVVFNPILAIPFLLVPVIQFLVAYGATAAGLVPHITAAIEWTTPVFISGYAATGSIAGSILQLVNILIGVAVYAPFVKMMGRMKNDREASAREEFVQWFRKNESRAAGIELTNLRGVYGDIARRMALELKDAVARNGFKLYYQPQYNYEGKCIGAEALLRWPVSEWLNVYPPLLIRLAREKGILLDMEERILNKAMNEREAVFRQFGRGIKISVNVTGHTVARQEYWDYLTAKWKEAPFTEGTLCIEVTEQDAVVFSEDLLAKFRACRDLGIRFAIDDFSAGQTSLEYLKLGIFDLLKLDGSLVRVVNENARCRDIIASMVTLSESLHIACLAEFVENDAIRRTLHSIGCDLYQGYLFSPAVPLKDMTEGEADR